MTKGSAPASLTAAAVLKLRAIARNQYDRPEIPRETYCSGKADALAGSRNNSDFV
jgi:hypothetical protein